MNDNNLVSLEDQVLTARAIRAMKIEKQLRKFLKPSIPTPPTLRHYKIGFIDELAPVMNVTIVLFFPASSNNNPNLVSQLEKSLEKTLTRFYPLAGRYVKESHTVDCNDQGAEFIHAVVDTKLKDVLDSEMNVELVNEFIPSEFGATDQVTDPILTTQVTMFECGGVALGVSISHRIADASTLSTFLNEWASLSQEENEVEFTGPGFNSSSLFPARGLPSFDLGFPRSKSVGLLNKYVTKKLTFCKGAITNIKAEAMLNGKNGTRHWSKVQLVSSLIWKALIDVDRARYGYPRSSILLQVVNLRGKTASLIPKSSCGNLWGLLATECTIAEGTEGLADLLTDSVRKTIENYSKVHHDSEEGQTMVLNSILQLTNIPNMANVIRLSSWCRFSFYEADFGFGKPIWANCGSVPFRNAVCLMDEAGGDGVEACVSMEVEDVPYFEQVMDIKAFAT